MAWHPPESYCPPWGMGLSQWGLLNMGCQGVRARAPDYKQTPSKTIYHAKHIIRAAPTTGSAKSAPGQKKWRGGEATGSPGAVGDRYAAAGFALGGRCGAMANFYEK